MTPPQVVGSQEDLEARLKIYAEMAAKGEKRNAPFLRTVWRSEKDPAVRAAIADALYRSDSAEWANARILLDTVGPGEDVFGRLRKAARHLSLDVPCVGPVTELAATGNAESLQKMFELTRAAEATDDDKLKGELADSHASIANEAPNEMIYALKVAPAKEGEAALDAMAAGFIRAAKPDAPWWGALKSAQGSLDPRTVEAAKRVEASLSQKIAEAKALPAVDGGPVIVPNGTGAATAGAANGG
jgi:D-alanyl-D-alanine carboxypeptidase/D-alanyl-D-alanine-endopeptidase (penicillin-binding protein 4)